MPRRAALSHPPVRRRPSAGAPTLLATGLTLAPAWSWAEEARAAQLPTVQVTGSDSSLQQRASSPKLSEPLRDTPQTVQIIPAETLQKQGATTLSDVFRNVSGLSFSAGEGNPVGGDQFKLRGFSARDDLFVDGVRDIGTFYRDPFNLESVEVSKGPAGAYNGRGSTGGSINQVAKSPKAQAFADASLTLGNDQTRRASLDLNRPLSAAGDAAWRLNLMAHDSEVNGRDSVRQKRFGIAPSLAFGLGRDTRLVLSAFHTEQDNLPDYGLPTVRETRFAESGFLGRVAPVDRDSFYGYTQRDMEDVRASHLTAKLDHVFSPTLSTRQQIKWQQVDHAYIVSAPRIQANVPGSMAGQFLINDTSQVVGNAKFRDSREQLLSYQGDLVARLRSGSVETTLVAGLELSRGELDNKRRLDVNGYATSLFRPDAEGALTPAQLGVFNGTRAEFDSQGEAVYLIANSKLSPQWQLGAGLRRDWVELRARALNDGRVPSYTGSRSRKDAETSWRASVVYKPVEQGSFYLGLGSSFDPASSSAAAAAGVTQPGGGNNNLPFESGFDVDPEATRSIELGSKWELAGGRLGLTGAIFRTDKRNARTLALDGTVSVDGRQRIEGVDLGLQGAITRDWDLTLNYTYLRGRILASGDVRDPEGGRIDNTPRHSLSLWTIVRPAPRWEAGFGLVYLDERSNRPASASGQVPVTVPGYTRLDATVAWQPAPALGLRLNVLNLGNKDYFESLGTAQAIPGATRTIRLSAHYRF